MSSETEAPAQDLHGSAPDSLHIDNGFQISVVWWLLSVWISGSLTLESALGFPLLVCFVQLWCAGLFHITNFKFDMLYCYFLEACSFLTRARKGVNPDGKGSRENLGGMEGGETVIRVYYIIKESSFNQERGNNEVSNPNRPITIMLNRPKISLSTDQIFLKRYYLFQSLPVHKQLTNNSRCIIRSWNIP